MLPSELLLAVELGKNPFPDGRFAYKFPPASVVKITEFDILDEIIFNEGCEVFDELKLISPADVPNDDPRYNAETLFVPP